MPWSSNCRPSAANAALTAYVRAVRPEIEVAPRSEFLTVSDRLGASLYDFISDNAYSLGDILYACQLYPSKRDDARVYFAAFVAKERPAAIEVDRDDDEAWLAAARRKFDDIQTVLADHVEAVARSLIDDHGLIGLTTSFGQLFANLCVARRAKALGTGATIVLGGSTVSSAAGRSLLGEYAYIDAIVQGEGELALVELLDSLVAGRPPRMPSILTRGRRSLLAPLAAMPAEVGHLDALPFPDYDEFAERAEEVGVEWALPLEGSRGCWWDRVQKTGNPKNTCYFCNLNLQWSGYREKSAERVAAEVATLSEKYRNLNVYFVDNIVRHKGVIELARRLKEGGRQLSIFYEARANLRPLEFLELWEAGLTVTQFGIEALSSAVLRRVGKGTTTIQNLQVMRLCTELRVENKANLIIDFPGTTAEEVAESARNILDYALAYEPLNLAKFHLGLDSTLYTLRDELGLTKVRNADYYLHGVPAEVLARLTMMDFDFELASPQASWEPVASAVATWRQLHAERPDGRLVYRDGGSFLVIEDGRFGDDRRGTFDAAAREIYLEIMDIQRPSALPSRLPHISAGEIEDVLGRFAEDRLVFREGDHVLALAVATSPRLAAARIRASAARRAAVERGL